MDEKLLLKKIDAFIGENRAAIVEDMARLIAVPSVRGESAGPGKPYGEEVRRALEVGLDIAKGFGLAVHDGGGEVGWAELPGREEGHIATITHVDVVPFGDGWTAAPTTLVEKDGWLIGRGIVDDKGPSVLCLYAAKFFKELDEPLRYGLRVLLGCSEETGMRDIDYYFKHNEQPLFAFSPDAEFPLCNGEKGHFGGELHSGELDGTLLEFDCGLAFNVIPAAATCLLKGDAAGLKGTASVTVANENGAVRLVAKGVGGHSAHPEGTQNAIGILVNYLLEAGLCTGRENAFLSLMQKLHSSPYGTGLGIDCKDDIFDKLTINGGVVKLENGRLMQSVDIRYPTVVDAARLTDVLAKAAEACGATFMADRADAPFFIPADSAPIQSLLKAYADVSGLEPKTFTMGGGTYARHFSKGVSFGPMFPATQRPDFAGPEHAANEGARTEDLFRALKIYILSLWRLQGVDLK